jgi:hypothetical protein
MLYLVVFINISIKFQIVTRIRIRNLEFRIQIRIHNTESNCIVFQKVYGNSDIEDFLQLPLF